MHASTSTILNVFLCSGLGAAQIIPHQPRGEVMEPPVARNAPAPATPVMADPAAAAAAEASGAPAAGGGAAPNAAGGTMNALCAQGTILAQGIALNIADQQQELTTANSLATILAANPVDTAAYGAARTDLLKFINNGIAIREMNQLITPQENQATPGIATVANAQLTELGLANNLTAQGGDNVAGNMQIVQTLQMDFMGGIMQNMKNMAAVSVEPNPSLRAVTPPENMYTYTPPFLRPWLHAAVWLPRRLHNPPPRRHHPRRNLPRQPGEREERRARPRRRTRPPRRRRLHRALKVLLVRRAPGVPKPASSSLPRLAFRMNALTSSRGLPSSSRSGTDLVLSGIAYWVVFRLFTGATLL